MRPHEGNAGLCERAGGRATRRRGLRTTADRIGRVGERAEQITGTGGVARAARGGTP